MNPLDWIPVTERTLAVFLLQMGIVSFAYNIAVLCIALPVASLGFKLKSPVDLGALLTVTVGHYVLTVLMILLSLNAIVAEPERGVLYGLLSGLFLWMTFAPELFVAYGTSASKQKPRSSLLFILQCLLMVLWIVLLALSIHGDVHIVHPSLRPLVAWLDDALALPYMIGWILGTLGVYSLFRSIFRAIFATLGLFGEIGDIFRTRKLSSGARL